MLKVITLLVVVGGVMLSLPPPPNKDIHILMAGTRKYITLYGQRDFEDMIQIRILRMGDVGLFGWAQCQAGLSASLCLICLIF